MAGSNRKASVCEKIFSVISCAPNHQQDAETSDASSDCVPIVFDDHTRKDHAHQTMLKRPSFEMPRKQFMMQAGKEGGSKPRPIHTRVFSEYIERAGTRIRDGSSDGARKPAMRRESFNKRATEYINRAKNKFMAKPSFVE